MRRDAPTFQQLMAWCEEFDGDPTEGWLHRVLSGEITIAALNAAVRAGEAPVVTTDRERTAELALRRIRDARDFHADHGRYPDAPDGPAVDQCFDDWAADVAAQALDVGPGEHARPVAQATLDSELRAYAHSWHVYMNASDPGQWAYTDALNVTMDNLDVAIEIAAQAGVTITEEEGVAWIGRERALQRRRGRS